MDKPFRDRRDAGRQLGEALDRYANRPDVVVLALPRGKVPVGYEVSRRLRAPLDVYIVRKLGVPGQEELAMGAVASGDVRIINENVVRQLGIPEKIIAAAAADEERELKRREWLYRKDLPHPELEGKTVIVVDDGLATGATMRAAIQAIRAKRPAAILVAVPVASPEACADLREEADGAVCLVTRDPFYAVGLWYEDFSQTTDEEVHFLLERAGEAGQAA